MEALCVVQAFDCLEAQVSAGLLDGATFGIRADAQVRCGDVASLAERVSLQAWHC